nr:universal stress protein [Planosporangium thailandense]
MPVRDPDVVVGVDGSACGEAALRWAATEAGRRAVPLRVLMAYQPGWPGLRFAVGAGQEEAARTIAEAVVGAAVDDARSLAPGLAVRGDAVAGHPAELLVAASRDAALVVVGSRGRGGFASLLLGSVGGQVAGHAYAPVVVVRGREDTTDGPVVVGVDGSPAADEALGQAYAHASRRGCPLVARTAYCLPLPSRWTDAATLTSERDKVEAGLRDELARAVAGWHTRFPTVVVDYAITLGGAADVLTALSNTAQLVVVGARGHEGFPGLALGSVGDQLIHHAGCPVLIARVPAGSKEGPR